MSSIHPQVAFSPVLRPDIEFFPGPDESDGSPTCVIHDPLRGTYEKATWVQTQILKLLQAPSTVDQLLEQLRIHTTIRVSREDISRLCADASRKGLTLDSRVSADSNPPVKSARASGSSLEALFRKLIYVRIGLVQPDAFLERTVGTVKHLAGPVACTIYVCLSVVGLALVAQRFDAYCSTFPRFFNWGGATGFALAIVGIKVIHELSHAYTAKALGNRVASMGVSLSCLLPLAYSDVTDSWRMCSRRKRLLISLAGVIAELVLAGVALLVWAISPAGVLKSICFVVSSTTLISTFLVNLNPLMRFDGYYVLSDVLGIDNLQSRSFAATRWALRRYLLGMNIQASECPLPSGRLAIMIAYSLATWVYRLFLYSAIALVLYHWVTKVVGGILFVAAVYSFMIKPLFCETLSLVAAGRKQGWNPRMLMVILAGGLILAWAAWPLPRWSSVPAITVPAGSQLIYSPIDGVAQGLAVGPGAAVHKGELLLTVASEELESRIRLAHLDIQRVGIELVGSGAIEKHRPLLRQKQEELARASAVLETLLAMRESSRVVAEVDGTLIEWNESLRNGTAIGADEVLGRIVNLQSPLVHCYVPHDLVLDVSRGQRVQFVSKAQPDIREGMVANVDPLRTSVLRHAGLSSVAGGDLAVIPDSGGQLNMVDSCYEVEVRLDEASLPLRIGQTGWVRIRTAPRSRLADLVRYLHKVLVRESSF